MEDFVFGTLANDTLKLLHYRTSRRGVRHAHAITPADPVPGEPVTLRVLTGADVAADHVACYYTVDGSRPAGSRGHAEHGEVRQFQKVDLFWDKLAWGYLSLWECALPPQPDGTVVRYAVSAWGQNSAELFADWPDLKATTEQAAAAYFRGLEIPTTIVAPLGPNVFTYHVDRIAPPPWFKDAVIYHILVDRFYPGDGRAWLNPAALDGFYGGTLWGVRDKLDYIADLGATCIWLSPTFPSPSHHGYDVTDYFHVESRYGGDEALKTLVDAAHQRGIRVLLDLVCNHLSSEHPIFLDARSNPNSVYREWFTFDESPVGYRTFFGVPSMPEINVHHPEARAWLLDIARYWLREYDVDGYRLDHANGPGPDFWPAFRAAIRAVKPDCICFGEVVEEPPLQCAYIGRLDGLLDFHVVDALRKTYIAGLWTEDELERFIAAHRAYFPSDFIMPTFLDNHDMDRFLFAAKGDKNALRQAAAVQMRLSGPPIIYYGTEVGLSQNRSKSDGFGLEESRLPMLWGDSQDQDMLAYYRALIRGRRQASA